VFNVGSTGNVHNHTANNANGVRPVVYLKSDIILTGSGTTGNPYEIVEPKEEQPVLDNGLIPVTISNGGTSPTEIDILFEKASDTMLTGDAVNAYRTHPAFWWDNDSDGKVEISDEKLAGIWVGKFETSTETSSTCYTTPCETNCNNANQSLQIIPNAHMMKNSEWGAVAYLSHSKYGVNNKIRINNNNNFITRCGASTNAGAATSSCETTYNAGSVPQSTTGNITGVYDMSGGSTENNKLCNGGICYGHAISETAG